MPGGREENADSFSIYKALRPPHHPKTKEKNQKKKSFSGFLFICFRGKRGSLNRGEDFELWIGFVSPIFSKLVLSFSL